jgi:hypothetical protein
LYCFSSSLQYGANASLYFFIPYDLFNVNVPSLYNHGVIILVENNPVAITIYISVPSISLYVLGFVIRYSPLFSLATFAYHILISSISSLLSVGMPNQVELNKSPLLHIHDPDTAVSNVIVVPEVTSTKGAELH